MDDGLAEQLYNAFWNPLVAAGFPPPASWADLHDAPRQAWLYAAAEARREMNKRVDDATEMLRGANDAWQRECTSMQTKLEQHVENVRAQTRATMANFADVLNDAIHANPEESKAMLADLRDSLHRISVVS